MLHHDRERPVNIQRFLFEEWLKSAIFVMKNAWKSRFFSSKIAIYFKQCSKIATFCIRLPKTCDFFFGRILENSDLFLERKENNLVESSKVKTNSLFYWRNGKTLFSGFSSLCCASSGNSNKKNQLCYEIWTSRINNLIHPWWSANFAKRLSIVVFEVVVDRRIWEQNKFNITLWNNAQINSYTQLKIVQCKFM